MDPVNWDTIRPEISTRGNQGIKKEEKKEKKGCVLGDLLFEGKDV